MSSVPSPETTPRVQVRNSRRTSKSSSSDSSRARSQRIRELSGFLSSLRIPETPEAALSQFYEIAFQLSQASQKPPLPQLKYLTAKLFEVMDLKNPQTFEHCQLDGHSAKWPTWKKAHKLCKYLYKYGVFDFVDDTAKSNINMSIQAIAFIHNFKKDNVVPEKHLATLKCVSEINFEKFIKETLALTTGWEEQNLKDLIETYLIENEISGAAPTFYLELARTFQLSRLLKDLTHPETTTQ